MNESTAICRRILVLARNEPEEAMRVAAGLTIIGHELELVFMHRPLTEDEAESEHAELLELCEIVPKTTVEGMREHFTLLDSQALAALISESERVISL
ncbi:hypothetical protein AB833_05415 [Chromatiales bacterium (ex Bugula neritina AB1)]|nr:hypothetical protein AB833_05415 [Chromatiales bacterium (ex Bugula neritina AB1)]